MPLFFLYLSISLILAAFVALSLFDVSDRVTNVVVRFAFGWVMALWVSLGVMLARF